LSHAFDCLVPQLQAIKPSVLAGSPVYNESGESDPVGDPDGPGKADR